MKTSTLLLGGLLAALSAAPAFSQVLTLSPGPGSGIVSSNGIDNNLTLQLDFNFNAALGKMSVKLWNLGDLADSSATYNVSQWGFNSPGAWGTASLESITPTAPETHTGGITAFNASAEHLFSSYVYNYWLGTDNGSGSSDKTGELGIDVGESMTFVIAFSSAPASNFDLAHFFSQNTGSDLGFRIQPMSPEPGSDKWALTYTPPTDTPPLTPVPEPTTYGLIGMAGLAALVGYRKLRRKA